MNNSITISGIPVATQEGLNDHAKKCHCPYYNGKRKRKMERQERYLHIESPCTPFWKTKSKQPSPPTILHSTPSVPSEDPKGMISRGSNLTMVGNTLSSSGRADLSHYRGPVNIRDESGNPVLTAADDGQWATCSGWRCAGYLRRQFAPCRIRIRRSPQLWRSFKPFLSVKTDIGLVKTTFMQQPSELRQVWAALHLTHP